MEASSCEVPKEESLKGVRHATLQTSKTHYHELLIGMLVLQVNGLPSLVLHHAQQRSILHLCLHQRSFKEQH